MKKKRKDLTKDELLTDLLNFHISKGNVKKEQVKHEHKHRIKK